MTLNNNTDCFIIAEAGVNHNGSLELAFKLIDAAKEAGVDAVKFQTFQPELLVVPDAGKAEYQKINTGNQETQQQMLKSLSLTESDFTKLKDYAANLNIRFLSTPFDLKSLAFLISLKVEFLKISSGDITNALLLLHAAQSQLPIIVSSGACTLTDIKNALAVLAFGYQNPHKQPQSFQDCLSLLEKDETWLLLKDKVTILHCTTDYPARPADINMRAMQTIAEEFGLTVGYSDHSQGILVPSVATACGAKVIEKHFTLNKTMSGPDHAASLEPDELKSMVQQIREVEKILGNAEKEPSARELVNRPVVRRGVYVACDIKTGEKFTSNNLITLRPENGTSPLNIWSLYNQLASRDYKIFEAI